MTTSGIRVTIAALTALLALGCAALAVGHAGVAVPVLSQIGPGGDRAVVPAAIAFTVAMVVLAAVAWGTWRGRPWAWALGFVAHALVFVGAAYPFRGVASLVALVVAGTCLALLITPAGRRSMVAR